MADKKYFKVEIKDENFLGACRIVEGDDHFEAFETAINRYPNDIVHSVVNMSDYFTAVMSNRECPV